MTEGCDTPSLTFEHRNLAQRVAPQVFRCLVLACTDVDETEIELEAQFLEHPARAHGSRAWRVVKPDDVRKRLLAYCGHYTLTMSD